MTLVAALLATGADWPADPNVLVEMSQDLGSATVAWAMDETKCVCERKNGAVATGPFRTRAATTLEFVPDDGQAAMDLVLSGDAAFDMCLKAGPVALAVPSTGLFQSRKRLYLDADGFRECPPESDVALAARLAGVRTRFHGPLDPLARAVTTRLFDRGRDEALRKGRADARRDVSRQFDAGARPALAKSQRDWLDQRRQLEESGLWPQRLGFRTTADRLLIAGRLDGPSPAAAPPPRAEGRSDLHLQLHEAYLNNAAHTLLAGKKFTAADFTKVVAPVAGAAPAAAVPDESFAVTFAAERPLALRFADGGVTVTIRTAVFTTESGDLVRRHVEPMDSTVSYRLEKTAAGLRAVRRGRVESLPSGFVPGRDRLSGRMQTECVLLQGQLDKLLKPSYDWGPVTMSGDAAKLGELHTTRVDSGAGWLTIGWRRVPPAR